MKIAIVYPIISQNSLYHIQRQKKDNFICMKVFRRKYKKKLYSNILTKSKFNKEYKPESKNN